MALTLKSASPGTARAPTQHSLGRADEVEEVREQLKNYHHLRDLVDEWIDLALELSRLRLRERRHAAAAQKNGQKNAKTQQNRKREAEK